MKKILFLSILLCSLICVRAQSISRQQQIANISSFAKLYGYARYFHPADEAAAINWDKFIYYGIQEVENSRNARELTSKLNEIFNPIVPAVQIVTGNAGTFDLRSITPANSSQMKEIFWQHYGMGGQSELYKSIRTNREISVRDPKRKGFGVASTSVAAIPYRGKKFRLRGAIKTEVNEGQGQMWLRIDLENKKIGFFDNMDSRPVKSDEWKEYEISGIVDQTATSILLGAFLKGQGKLWIDKFTLEIENDGVWTAIPIANPSFEDDAEPKKWHIGSPGYIYAITNEAFEGKQALLINDSSTSKIAEPLFKEKPVFGEYVTKPIGNGISCIVPLVLMGTDQSTYPAANAAKLKILQSKLKSINSNDGYPYVALTGVVATWNVFQHFFPYHKEIDQDWEAQLIPALNNAYQAKTTSEYASVLRVLTEKLQDGHVSLNYGQFDYFSIQANAVLAEGNIVISQVDTTDRLHTVLNRGDIVVAIDGINALTKLNALKKEISGSEQWKNNLALNRLFDGERETEVILKVKNGRDPEREIKLLRSNYRKAADNPTIKKMDNGIYYINIGNTAMNDIKEIMPELVSAKGIICDLRGYPKGNHELINHLMSVQDTNKWMFVPKIIYPDYEKVTYDGMGWNLTPAKPHINAKVIFLTGGGAISYAESYMGFIKHYKLATIVGQPTAGANGNVNPFSVAGNCNIRFTGMKVKLQDGGQLHSLGIQPDVFVSQTVKGVSEGRDEYLEKAMELLK